MTAARATTPVVVEIGARRVFASALAWPGWCRSGKDEPSALEALADYAARFSAVAEVAGVTFPTPPRAGWVFEVVERTEGSATTDFGAPAAIARVEYDAVTAKEAARLASLVAATWTVFDAVVEHAPPALRKGPRGGGRDRDAVVEHVYGGEHAYAGKLGVRLPQPSAQNPGSVAAHRQALLEVLGQPSDGAVAGAKDWPRRYAARRIAWHVLDHAWEIEDKSIT